ncbi:uncharacterized protein At4g18490-like isoform X2 [Papaver somniferum]|uniref:uncharacterized protein At4g18490-like isoform X2 n=1 Tax=Papaver somniferum TaxID=3469 RepID=UPI000E7029CA|nr:uncharacterized protein At4g18490-like isoform X2 [Papaver somniferum]
MVESPKEAASNCKTKSSLLDEEIGKDFFSSWKSVSGAEDDAMDFTSPSLSKGSKGKKSNFNFDKLDMDFALDGDFGNIPSSFKISMPDLDFSSPPRRPGKPNETNGKELESGKFDNKQDRFNFSFDFNALDSFDLDSSPKIGEKKSDKTAESASDRALDPVREHEKNQSSRGNKAAGGSENHDSLSDKNPSTSTDVGKLKGLESFDLDSSWNEGENNSDRNAETGKEKKSGSLHEQTQYSRSNLGGGGINANQKNQSSRGNMAAGGSKNDDSLGDGNPSTSTDIGKLKVVENFHLDSSWTEGENKTDAGAETGKEKKSEFLHEQTQYSRSNLGGGSDAFEGTESDKFLTPKRVTTSMAVHSRGSSVKDDSRINCSPSRSANVQNLNVPHGATSLEKEGNICTKVTNQLGQEMEGTVPTEQRYQHSTQDLCISSVSGSDSIQEAVPELTAEHSPDAQVKSTIGGEQDIGVKMVAGLESNLVDTSNLECSSPLDVRKQQKTNISVARKLDTQNTGSTGDSDTVASAQSDIVKDAAVASVSQDTLLSKHHMKEDRSVSKHLLPPLHRLHIGNENTKVVNQRARASCSSDTRRKALPIAPESVKNDIQHNISGSQDHPSRLLQQKSKSGSLKCVNPRLPVSSIAPIRSNKSIASTKNDKSPSNVLKKTPDNPCLKVSRPMTSKNDLPHSNVPREIKSLSPRVGNPGVSINATSEIVHSLGLQKYGLSSPSLKRKNIEGSDADPAASYPFKRFAESPNDSRKPNEASEKFEKSLTLQSSSYQSTSTVEFTLDSRLSTFGVPLTMENDGIAEKAEAYTKELEDICNMLKKKHEEAKEILVRAIVNNNNLLMLNHPVYEEKIRAVQRFAARMLQRDLQV